MSFNVSLWPPGISASSYTSTKKSSVKKHNGKKVETIKEKTDGQTVVTKITKKHGEIKEIKVKAEKDGKKVEITKHEGKKRKIETKGSGSTAEKLEKAAKKALKKAKH